MGLLGHASNVMHRPRAVRGGMTFDNQDSSVEDDEEDGAEDDFVRPCVPKKKSRRKPGAPAQAEGLFESFAQAAPQLMAEGKLEEKDLRMLSLVEKVMKRDAKVEARQDSNEDEDDSEGETVDRWLRGLRRVDDSNQIAIDTKVHPTRIIEGFELASALSLGLKPGVPWTLQDVRKIGNWLKAIAEIRKRAPLDNTPDADRQGDGSNDRPTRGGKRRAKGKSESKDD